MLHTHILYYIQGYGELSPVGVCAAVSMLAVYGSMCVTGPTSSNSISNHSISTRALNTSPTHGRLSDLDHGFGKEKQVLLSAYACCPERLLHLSYHHGLVGLLSLSLLPQVLCIVYSVYNHILLVFVVFYIN